MGKKTNADASAIAKPLAMAAPAGTELRQGAASTLPAAAMTISGTRAQWAQMGAGGLYPRLGERFMLEAFMSDDEGPEDSDRVSIGFRLVRAY